MEGIDPDREFATVEEAAGELGTTPTKVLMMLRSKELAGTESGDGWLVRRDSLACAKSHGIDRKEASGCASYCKSKCGCG